MMTLNVSAAWQDDRQLRALIDLGLPAFETLSKAFKKRKVTPRNVSQNRVANESPVVDENRRSAPPNIS